VLERTADDISPPGRDSLSGWGRLDIASALTALTNGALPPEDHFETNDDIAAHAPRLAGAQGKRVATVDYWDDQTDVYPVDLAAHRRFSVSLSGSVGRSVQLRLWSPQTRSIFGAANKLEVAHSTRVGATQRLSYLVPARENGRYYLQITMTRPGSGAYALSWTKR